jgi:hypothetical protein
MGNVGTLGHLRDIHWFIGFFGMDVKNWMAKLAARIGDGCKALGWHSVPLSSFRLNNIRTEYVFDMRPIMEISGPLPYSLKAGVERTVEWMRDLRDIHK